MAFLFVSSDQRDRERRNGNTRQIMNNERRDGVNAAFVVKKGGRVGDERRRNKALDHRGRRAHAAEERFIMPITLHSAVGIHYNGRARPKLYL